MYGSNGSHDGMYGIGQPDEPPECAAVAAQLDAYHDGLRPAEDAHAVASHVAGCARCAARLDALVAADQLVRSAPAPRVGPELRQRLYERIAAAQHTRLPSAPIPRIRISEKTMNDTGPYLPRAATPHRSPRKLTVWLSGIAAALIVALLAGAFLMQGHGPNHGGPIVGSGSTPSTPSTCAANAINVTLPAHAYLADLAMTSATDGWAVGAVRDNNDNAPVRSLILHYSHCQWTQTGPTIPNMGLWSISMDSPTDGWISGGLDGTGNVLLHYTGGQWQQVHVATLDNMNGFFGAVRIPSATEGWMILLHAKNAQGLVSSSLAHERNGAWSLLNAPFSNIADVAPVGPDDVWVAGTVSDADKTGMLAHYQAGRWVATASMGGLIDESHLRLRMVSPTDGWVTAELPTADGNYFEGVETALVLHYDGKTWMPVTTGASPAAQRVSIFGDGEGWAFTLTHHADNVDPGNLSVLQSQYESGGTWRTVQMPASNISDIAGLNRVSAGDYWAIAYIETAQPSTTGPFSFVLLHFANGTWTQYGR